MAVAVVLTAGWLVYVPGLSGSFLFDDFPNIVNNDHLKMTALTLDQLLSAAFSSHAGPLYRPIAMASFALNRYFAGLDPYWFKFTNVMIHLACGVLVITLSRLLLASYREQRALWLSPERVRWVALLLGAAWIVNPLNLTAVLYIVQRMVSLASFFMLASTCFYVVGRRRQLAGRSGWAFIWIGAPIMAFFGLFSKEIAALMPLYLVVIEGVIFQFRGSRTRFNRPIIVFFALGLVIPLLFGLGWFLIHLHAFLGGYHGRSFTVVQRLLTEARVLMLDIKWTLIPNVADLSLYHDDIAISTGLLTPVTTLLSILGIAVLLVVTWLTRRRAPLVALGILWFFAGHALESTILPLEIVHEHRNYLPDYGLLLAVVSLLLLPRAPTRKFMMAGSAVGLIFVALLASVTWARSSEWSSKLTQAYYEAQHHPGSPRATYSYAALEADLAMHGQLKDPNSAFRDLEASMRTNKSTMPNVALVMLASSLKRPIEPAWLADMRRKLHTRLVNSEDVDALDKLVQCERNACKLNKQQLGGIFKAAFTNPRLSHHSYNYANALTIYINYLSHQHAPLDELIGLMYRVVSAQPQIPQYRINLANALIVRGKIKEARAQIAVLHKMNTIGELNDAIHDLESQTEKKQPAAKPHSRKGGNPVESTHS
ncbi:MAG TPA: hypothetical protein VFK96_01395 [Gammaproteobacteria bacterium]|nr:hypothetical protein [Gammaproteobacteria bacterium]